MTGHKEAVKAASFIWSNNLTKNLTWKLKDSRLWAFFFDMQLLFLNENIGGLNAARIRHQIHEMKNSFNDKIEFVKTQFDKLSFEIYDYLSDRNSEATFNQAMMLYQGIGTNKNTTRAFEIWENMIESSLNGNISLNNFAPALLAKSYYSAKEIFQ